MDDYLSKPIRAADLLAAIDRVAFGGEASSTARPSAGDHASLIDATVLLAACGGFEKLLDEKCQLPECNNRERTGRRIANRHARPARPYVTDGSRDHSDLRVVELRGEAGDLFRQGRVGVLGPVVEPELRGGEARRGE